MLWGRSGFAGSHMIPAAWAGDSSTALNNHASVLRGGLSIAMSGIPFWGFDMGGFYNTDHNGYECPPEPEEYIRSCQFGFFSPLSRCHGKTPREPWNFGREAENIFRACNDIRHRLLPYLYIMAHRAHTDAVPMLRPLVMEYPEDRNARNIDLEYFLGDSMLVAPVFDQDSFELYLPEGGWLDFHDRKIIMGNRWIALEPRLEQIPVFIREDSMIPMLTEAPEDMEAPYGDMELLVHLSSEIEQKIYDVDREYDFKARLDGSRVVISTDLPAVRIMLYTRHEVSETVVNGETQTGGIDKLIYQKEQ